MLQHRLGLNFIHYNYFCFYYWDLLQSSVGAPPSSVKGKIAAQGLSSSSLRFVKHSRRYLAASSETLNWTVMRNESK